jgi:hypothetical protein
MQEEARPPGTTCFTCFTGNVVRLLQSMQASMQEEARPPGTTCFTCFTGNVVRLPQSMQASMQEEARPPGTTCFTCFTGNVRVRQYSYFSNVDVGVLTHRYIHMVRVILTLRYIFSICTLYTLLTQRYIYAIYNTDAAPYIRSSRPPPPPATSTSLLYVRYI